MAAKKALEPRLGKKLTQSDVVAQLARRKTDGTDGRKVDLARAAHAGVTIKHPAHRPNGHKFRAGQTVTLLPNRYGSNRNGSFEVTRLLPEEHGINHYRLKSVADGHERVAAEDELL